VVLALVAPGAGAAEVAKSDNVRPIARFSYEGGTELAYDGRYLYAGRLDGITQRGEKPDSGGVEIFDTRGKVKHVASISCPGNDNDVAIVRKGLLALAFHTNRCAAIGAGVAFFDVSDPRDPDPKPIGSIPAPGSHTITPYPGTDLLYVNGGGLYGEPVSIVDTKDPAKPKIVAEFDAPPLGCHDMSFRIKKDSKLGFCAGEGQVTIFDVSDPLAPSVVSVIANPLIQFGHYALPSPDGEVLVIDDEAFVAHDCATGQSPTGAAWFYDISDPALPILAGRFAVGRGAEPAGTDVGWTQSWCTSHHYNFVPGTRKLVISWFSAGTSVLDLSDPSAPEELAYYQPSDGVAYTSHYFGGRVFINDSVRGLEVLKVKGL